MDKLTLPQSLVVVCLVTGAVIASTVGHDHALAGTLAGIAGGLLPGTLARSSLPPSIHVAAPIAGAIAGGGILSAILGA